MRPSNIEDRDETIKYLEDLEERNKTTPFKVLSDNYIEQLKAVLNYSPRLTIRKFKLCKEETPTVSRWEGTYLDISLSHTYQAPNPVKMTAYQDVGVIAFTPDEEALRGFPNQISYYSFKETLDSVVSIYKEQDVLIGILDTDFKKDGKLLTTEDINQFDENTKLFFMPAKEDLHKRFFIDMVQPVPYKYTDPMQVYVPMQSKSQDRIDYLTANINQADYMVSMSMGIMGTIINGMELTPDNLPLIHPDLDIFYIDDMVYIQSTDRMIEPVTLSIESFDVRGSIGTDTDVYSLHTNIMFIYYPVDVNNENYYIQDARTKATKWQGE